MRRFGWVALALVFLMLAGTTGALAEKRIALVIGNSAYQNTPKLTNPKNDATDMAAVLKKYGFEVIDGFDLDKAAFDRKVREFATTLRGSDAGIFFYAGTACRSPARTISCPSMLRRKGQKRWTSRWSGLM